MDFYDLLYFVNLSPIKSFALQLRLSHIVKRVHDKQNIEKEVEMIQWNIVVKTWVNLSNFFALN